MIEYRLLLRRWPKDLEADMNDLAKEGWTIHSVHPHANATTLVVMHRRSIP